MGIFDETGVACRLGGAGAGYEASIEAFFLDDREIDELLVAEYVSIGVEIVL